MTHTTILGGGALGLTLAYRLAARGERVTVLEREALPGGLAAGFRVGDVWLEKFYHHIFRSDRDIIALIDELGLTPKLVWPQPKNPLFYDGVPHRLDSPLSVLRFPPLSFPDRVRLAAAIAYLKFAPPIGLEGQNAAPWIQRWMGAEPYRVVWEPLLRGKFGSRANDVSLPWFWARIHDRSMALGYLRGGFQQIYDRLTDRIRAFNGDVQFDTTVHGVTRTEAGFTVTYGGRGGGAALQSLTADRVVSTLPPRLTLRLAPQLPASYRARHDWGDAYGAHCLILALDRPLIDGYWMNINDPGFPFMVLVEHTNYMSPADYGGRHIIYLGNYRPMDDPLMAADKDAVMAEFLPAIRRINPAFQDNWVEESWMFRAPNAQPIVTVDYKDHIPPFTTPILGLYQASMFQVYPHDRGQNYSVQLATKLAAELRGI